MDIGEITMGMHKLKMETMYKVFTRHIRSLIWNDIVSKKAMKFIWNRIIIDDRSMYASEIRRIHIPTQNEIKKINKYVKRYKEDTEKACWIHNIVYPHIIDIDTNINILRKHLSMNRTRIINLYNITKRARKEKTVI